MTKILDKYSEAISILNEIVKRKTKTIQIDALSKEIGIKRKDIHLILKGISSNPGNNLVTIYELRALIQRLKDELMYHKRKEVKSDKRVKFKIIQKSPEVMKAEVVKSGKLKVAKRINLADFAELKFQSNKELIDALKKIKRIKNKGDVRNIFNSIKSYLIETNVKENFHILLKKTNSDKLKAYFGNIIFSYCKEHKINFENGMRLSVNRHQKAAQLLKWKNSFKKQKKVTNSKNVKGFGNSVSKVYGSPGKYGKLISNLPRS